MRIRYFILLSVILVFGVKESEAQLGEYSFARSSATYTALTTASIPLDTVGAPQNYLRRTYHIQLPFTFKLGNITSDSVWVDLTGFCALKATSAPVLGISDWYIRPLSAMSYYEGVIAAHAGTFGITKAGINNLGIRTDVSGTSPNRVFTIEWWNLYATNKNVQVKLYETTNVIEFCYNGGSLPGFGGVNYEVGLRLADSTLFTGKAIARTNKYINPVNNTPAYRSWDTTFAATTYADNMLLSSSTFMLFNGLKYTWTPPQPCTSSAPTATLADSIDICAGATVLLTPGGLRSGLSYQWQTSDDGQSWSNVSGGTGAQNFQYIIPRKRTIPPVWYRLQATCTSNSQISYSNKVKIKSSYQLPPYFEGFENIVASENLPDCMTTAPKTNSLGYNWRPYLNFHPYDGRGSMQNYTPGREWLYTPGIYLVTGKQYRFSHMFKRNPYTYGADTMVVGVGTLPTPDSIVNVASDGFNQVPLYPTSMPSLTDREKYRRMEVYFTVPSSGIYFGGIRRSALDDGGAFVDNLEIMEVPAIDAMVDSLVSPSIYSTNCFEPQMDVKIRVRNAGTQSINNIPVYYKLNNVTYGPEIINQTLAAGDNIIYTFSQKASMPGIDVTYKLAAWASLSGDTYHLNDTGLAMAITTDTVKQVPYLQTFESSSSNLKLYLNYFRWYGNSNVSHVATTSGSSRILRIDFGKIATGGKDSIGVAPVGPVAENSFLRFKYRMTDTSGNTATMQNADTIYVLGRMDCNLSVDTLLKINASMQTNSSALKYAPTVALKPYAGGRIRLSFVTRKASTSNIFFDIDSFQVINMKPVDIALTAMPNAPSAVCIGDSVSLKVVVKNLGALNAAGFPIKVMVDGQPTSINYIHAATLPYLEADTVTVGNIGFLTLGLHDVKVYAAQLLDTTNTNDTVYRQVYVVNPATALNPVDTTLCNTASLRLNNSDTTVALWYTDNLPGTAPFHGGNELNNISSSDTFFVRNASTVPSVAGAPARNINWSSSVTLSNYGLSFNARSGFILDSVGIYVSGNGGVTIEVRSCASCTTPISMGVYGFTYSNASPTDKQMVPIHQYIPAGTDYAIVLTGIGNPSGVIRDFPFTGFPLETPGSPVIINYSKAPSGISYDYYYYFYDWKIRALSSCTSAESKVAVRLVNSPVTGFNTTVTNGRDASFVNNSTGGGNYVWDFGDGNSSTAVSPSHTYAADGTYQVKLSQTNDCGNDAITKTLVIDAASIDGIQAEQHAIVVYPNPANNKINIAFNAEGAGLVLMHIVDVSGRTVSMTNVEVEQGANVIEQDVSHMNAGFYYLIVNIDNKESRIKLTVLR